MVPKAETSYFVEDLAAEPANRIDGEDERIECKDKRRRFIRDAED